MSKPFTHKKLTEVKDSAPDFGVESMEVRFAKDDFDAEDTGFSHFRIHAGKKQGFGHVHANAEEVYVIVRGSGRVKLDDEIIEVAELDAIRVSPTVTRSFEAGDDGLEYVAFGPRVDGDGEIIQGWWSD